MVGAKGMRLRAALRQITWLEIAAAVCGAAVAGIYLLVFLGGSCYLVIEGTPLICTSYGLQAWPATGVKIFRAFIIPVEFFVIPASIALVRTRLRGRRSLSPLGYFAMAWPVLSLPLLHPIYYLCALPIGVGLPILAASRPRPTPLDFVVPFVWNMAWLFVLVAFSIAIWSTGD
jgi:hypothetical protein